MSDTVFSKVYERLRTKYVRKLLPLKPRCNVAFQYPPSRRQDVVMDIPLTDGFSHSSLAADISAALLALPTQLDKGFFSFDKKSKNIRFCYLPEDPEYDARVEAYTQYELDCAEATTANTYNVNLINAAKTLYPVQWNKAWADVLNLVDEPSS